MDDDDTAVIEDIEFLTDTDGTVFISITGLLNILTEGEKLAPESRHALRMVRGAVLEFSHQAREDKHG